MKKRVIFLVLISFLITGVVSAASLWGTYKGNQVIRLTVDGVATKVTDVPAISYNGRTMIPIYLLQQAGIQYNWDGKNQTVDVVSSQPTSPVISNQGDTKKIKVLFKAADYFTKSEGLGSLIAGTSNSLSLAYQSITIDDGRYLKTVADNLSQLIDAYNGHVAYFNSIDPSLSSNGIDILPKANEMMNNYSDAIDYFKASYSALVDFSANRSINSFNTYLSNSSRGFDTAGKGRVTALTQYFYYRDQIDNY